MYVNPATIEAWHVHLSRQAPWLDEFKIELLAFPNSHHDDQVDTFSQFLNWFDNRPKCGMVKLQGL